MKACVECLQGDIIRLTKIINHIPQFCMCPYGYVCDVCPNHDTPEDEYPCNECNSDNAWKHWNPRDAHAFWLDIEK